MKKIRQKNKNTNLNVANKIKLDCDIKLYTDKKYNPKIFVVFRWFLAYLCTFSVLIMTKDFVPFDVGLFTILFFALISTVLFSLVKSKNKIISLFGFSVSALILLFILFEKDKTVNGFFIFADKYLTLANQPSTYFSSYISGLHFHEKENAVEFFYLALAMITGFGATAGCVYRLDFCVLFIFTFPVFELGLYWGWEPNLPACLTLIICWAIILSLNIVNHSTNKAGRNNTYAVYKKKKTYFFTSPDGKNCFNGIATRFTALICAGIFTFVILFSAVTGFVRPNSFNIYRRNISKIAENFTLDNILGKNDTENVGESFGFFGIKSVGGTNGGILGQSEGISFNGSTALKISLPEFKNPLYLKGYCGGEYRDNTWNAIKINTEYGYYNIFRNEGTYPQDITNINLGIISENGGYQFPEQKINVEIKGASTKFAYAPYGTNYSGSNTDKKMQMCEESYIVPNKKKFSFTFRNTDSLFTSYYNLGTIYKSLSPIINNGELTDVYSEYSKFVFDNYLNTTGSDALNEAYNTIVEKYLPPAEENLEFSDGESGSIPYTYQQVYEAIELYFQDNFEYTLNPGATPEGKDFIDYFLTKQKKGYCSYFATAGTELLRMFGFPARYVEGYIVLPSQYQNGEIEVKDTSAHAWSEVYFEQIGWVPAEFTPGFKDDNPNLNLYNKSSKNNSSKSDSSSVASSSKAQSSSQTVSSSKAETSVSESKNDSSKTTKKNNSSTGKNSKNQSSKTNNSSLHNSSQKENNSDKTDKSPPLVLIILAGIIIGSLSVISVRRHILIKRKKDEIYHSGFNDGVKNIYRYTLKILSLVGIETSENLTDKQLSENILKQSSEKQISLDSNDIRVIFENAVKAQLSNHNISETDFEKSEKAMKNILEKTVLPNLNAYEKCIAMFIKCFF